MESQNAAAIALSRINLPADRVVPVIEALRRIVDEQPWGAEINKAAIEALWQINLPADQVAPVVETLHKKAEYFWNDNEAAIGVLGKYAVSSEQATSALKLLARTNRQATQVLGNVKLANIQKDPHENVSLLLLQHLRNDDESRLDANYRYILVNALAYWYNAGQDEAGKYNPFAKDPRARQEHADLQKELENLRDTGPLWLRAAAAGVWMNAYVLRPHNN